MMRAARTLCMSQATSLCKCTSAPRLRASAQHITYKCTTDYAHSCTTNYAQVHLDYVLVHNRLRTSAPRLRTSAQQNTHTRAQQITHKCT